MDGGIVSRILEFVGGTASEANVKSSKEDFYRLVDWSDKWENNRLSENSIFLLRLSAFFKLLVIVYLKKKGIASEFPILGLLLVLGFPVRNKFIQFYSSLWQSNHGHKFFIIFLR